MRLIDADEQIRILESIKKKAVSNGNEVVFRVNNVIKFFNDSTTAYDIDKVVEKLEELADNSNDHMYESYFDGKEDGIREAIEIVKQGGVDVVNNATTKNDDVCEWKFEETNGIAWHCDEKCTTYNQVYIKDLKITLEDFECKCPYCGKKIKVVE